MASRTLGVSGANYSTPSAYASYVNALTFTEPEVCEVLSGGEIVESSNVVFGGWSGGSSTNTLTFRPAAGQGFRDHANKLTNALKYNASNGAAIRCGSGYTAGLLFQGPYIIVDGLQFRSTAATANYVVKFTGTGCSMRNCIVYGQPEGNRLIVHFDCLEGTSYNNLLVRNGGNNIGATLAISGTNHVHANNLLVSLSGTGGSGMNLSYHSNVVLQNNAVVGFGAGDIIVTGSSLGAGSGYNATDQASFNHAGAGTTGGQTSLVATTEFESVTNGSEDLRLKSTSVKLKGLGTAAGLSTDIVGSAWPTPKDIGVWSSSAGGDTTAPVITGPGGATGSTSSISVAEGTTTVFDFDASETVTWSLNGGADVAFFSINSSTGVLSFIAPRDFESPADAGANNTYVVGVRATDAATNATTQTVTVTITDAAEGAPKAIPFYYYGMN